VSFAAITLCVASQRLFVVVDFVIDSIRKLLDTPVYLTPKGELVSYRDLSFVMYLVGIFHH
jgi:hypothetical protein